MDREKDVLERALYDIFYHFFLSTIAGRKSFGWISLDGLEQRALVKNV